MTPHALRPALSREVNQMTRQELIEKINTQTKRTNRYGIAWLTSLCVIIVLMAVLTDGSAETTSTAEIFLAAALLVVVLGAGLVFALLSYRSMRRSGLVCPHCHKLLTPLLMQIAVASGNCGKCGRQIVTIES